MSTRQPTFLDCELNMSDIVMLIKVEALSCIVIEESNGNALFDICSLIFVVRVGPLHEVLRESMPTDSMAEAESVFEAIGIRDVSLNISGS